MSLDIGIVGCGNSARALAFYLTSQGHSVWIYARNAEKSMDLANRLTLSASGKMNGTVKISGVTSDIEYFCKKVSIIFIATQATAYSDVAEKLSSYLDPKKHFTILFSGKLLGCLEFREGLRDKGKEAVKVIS